MPAYPTVGSSSWSAPLKAYIDAYGASTTNMGVNLGASSGTDDTSAINTILSASAGQLIRGFPGQTYLISAPLIIKSNTTLDLTGCTMQLKPASACNMLNNTAVSTVQRTIAGTISAASKNFTLTTGTATSADVGRTFLIAGAGPNAGMFTLAAKVATFTDSTHVVLDTAASTSVTAASTSVYDRDVNIRIVGGTWDRGNNNGGTGAQQHSMYLRRVDGLLVDIDRFISTGTGPKYAIHPGDVTKFSLRVRDFDHVSDGIHVRGPASKGVIWGSGGSTDDDMIALGASDSTRITDGGGNISEVEVYDLRPLSLNTNFFKIYGNTGTTVTGVHLNGVRGAQGGTACAIGATDVTGVSMDDIVVENIRCDHPTPVLVNGSGGKLTVRNVSCTDTVVTDVTAVVSVIAGQTWDRITVENVLSPNMATQAGGSSIIQVNGTVTDLVLDKAKFTAPSSGCAVLLNNAASSISRLMVSNVTQTNGGAIVKAATSTHTLGEVWLRDCYCTGTSFIGDFATATTLHLSGVVSSALANNLFNARATASLKIYGESTNTFTGTGVSLAVTAGAVVSNYSTDLPFSATAGAVPTIAAGAGAGTGPTISIVGSDRMGTITITTGTTPSAAILATVTFTRAFGAAPRTVHITPTTSGAAAVNPYISSKTTTTFVLSAQTAPVAATSHIFDYLVTG